MQLLARLRAARLLWPAVLTAAALPVLLGLGTWQLQRKAWKEGLIAALHTRAHAAPISLDELFARQSASHPELPTATDFEYTRVALKGRFLNADERYLYALDDELGPGEHVYTPFATSDGHWLVMVNRGFVTAEKRPPQARPDSQREGDTEVVGLVRSGETKNMFEPANDPAHNQWFYKDISAMAAGVSLTSGRALAPFVVDAEAAATPAGGWPKGGVTRLVLPNRHLEYAFTWYGLAVAMLAVFAMFALERLKEPDSAAEPDPEADRHP